MQRQIHHVHSGYCTNSIPIVRCPLWSVYLPLLVSASMRKNVNHRLHVRSESRPCSETQQERRTIAPLWKASLPSSFHVHRTNSRELGSRVLPHPMNPSQRNLLVVWLTVVRCPFSESASDTAHSRKTSAHERHSTRPLSEEVRSVCPEVGTAHPILSTCLKFR